MLELLSPTTKGHAHHGWKQLIPQYNQHSHEKMFSSKE